jgi:effector-binding domain-containing protein
MESGTTDDLVWEIDPATGPRVLADVAAASTRRFNALLRGSRPTALYKDIVSAGTRTLDGREHVALRMTPAAGKPDTWYVDLETGLVSRIDVTLPASEGAVLVWGFGEELESQVTFGDWKKIDGVQYPHRRSVKMGPATVTFTCSKIEPNAKIEAERFAPPESVTRLEGKPAARLFKTDSGPGYHIVDREPQNVASVRLKCRMEEISATLTVIFPEVIAHLNATGAKMAGVPFVRYHAMNGSELDLEAGLPVAKPVTEKGRIKNGQLPGGRTLVAWHVGPYDKLAEAHQALRAYLETNQLKSRGGPWEVYWTDPGVVQDSSKWRTQLFMPIEN